MKSHTVLPADPLEHDLEQKRPSSKLLLQIAVFSSLVGVSYGGSDDGGLGRQLLWGVLGLAAILYVGMSFLSQHERQFSFGGWLIPVLIVYTFASAAWSILPITTVKRAVVLALLLAVCVASVGIWSRNWREDIFSKLLATPLLLLIGLSLVFTLLAPGWAFTDIGWHGLTTHKNTAGQLMAFTVLLLLYGVCFDKLGFKMRIAFLLVAVGMLMLAKSTTSLITLILTVGFAELVTLRRILLRLGSWQVGFFALLLMASALLFISLQLDLLPSASSLYSELLASMGKSETLTGRTAIWELVLGESRFHNPWIGGGYGGFWAGRDSVSGYVIIGASFYPGQAHNGYVDIFNDLGILGLALLSAMVLTGLYRTSQLLELGHPEAKLHLAIVLISVFQNIGESTFFRNTMFMNIIFLASFIRCGAILAQANKARLEAKPL